MQREDTGHDTAHHPRLQDFARGPPAQDADHCGHGSPPLPPSCLLGLLSLNVHGNVGKETRGRGTTVLVSWEGSPRAGEKRPTVLAGEGGSKALNGTVNPAPFVLKSVEIPSVWQ